ncbi:hypothetical protein B566_EDAN008586 [Ephemera danica]|nr:hypothetical protein B566_EDAN008586 [Ephemera danica]
MEPQRVQQLLGTECNVILECIKCRSLFRSIANFISHKRAYCNKPYNAETHDTGYQEVYSTIESINLRAAQTGSDGVRGENPEATQRSQYFTAVAEAVKERRAARTDICITLSPLPGTSTAVTQNVAKHEMKKCTVELTPLSPPSLNKMLQAHQNKSPPAKASLPDLTKRPRGRPRKMSLDQVLVSSAVSGSSSNKLKVGNTKGLPTQNACTNYCCEKCHAQFTTQKSLSLHESTQHMTTRLQYRCPCCQNSFCNLWSTYRHLKLVHEKTQEQIDKLKPAWLGNDNNFTVDVGDHRCGICGLRFERKAALVSHTNTCHKKPPNPGPKPRSGSPTSSQSSSVERGGRPAGKPGRKSVPMKLVRTFVDASYSSNSSPEKSQPAQISPAKSDSAQASPAKQESPKVPTPITSPPKTPVKTPSKELTTPVKSPEIHAKQSPVKDKTSEEKSLSNGPISPKDLPMKSRPNIIKRRRILPKPPVLTSAATIPNPPATVPTLTREVPDQSEKMPPPLSPRPPVLEKVERLASVEKCTQLSLKPKPVEQPAPTTKPKAPEQGPTKCNGPPDAHRFIKISSGEVITLTATTVRPEDKSKVITITPMLKSNMVKQLGQAAVIAGDSEGMMPKVIKLHRIAPSENGEKLLCVKQLINMQGLNGKGAERGLEDALSQQRAEILVRTVNTEKTPSSVAATPKENAVSEVMLVKHAASTSLPGNWFAAGSADRKWSGLEPGSRSNIQVRRDYAKCAYSSESSCSPRPGSSQQDFTLPTNEEESSSSDEVDGEVNGEGEVNGVDSEEEEEESEGVDSEEEQEGGEVNERDISEEADSVEGIENSEDSQFDEENFQGWDANDSGNDLQSRLGLPQLTDMSLVYDLIDSEDSSSSSSGEETSEIDSLEVASRDFDSDSPHNSQGPESDSALLELESPDSAVQELDQDSHEILLTQQSEPDEDVIDSNPPPSVRVVRSAEHNVRKTRAKVSDFNLKRMKLDL